MSGRARERSEHIQYRRSRKSDDGVGFSMIAPPISNKLRERSEHQPQRRAVCRKRGRNNASVPPDPTKTAATQRTSQRAERAIKCSAMREQLTSKTGLAYDGGRAAALLPWMRSGAKPSGVREHLSAADRAGK